MKRVKRGENQRQAGKDQDEKSLEAEERWERKNDTNIVEGMVTGGEVQKQRRGRHTQIDKQGDKGNE